MLKPLVTERLIVREFVAGDRVATYRNIYHDRRVLDNYIGTYAEEEGEVSAQPWLDKLAKGQYVYSVVRREDNVCVGFVLEKKRREKEKIELVCAFGSKYWEKGYATEAFSAVVKKVLEDGFQTVVAGFFKENTRAKRVLEKSGLEYDYIDWAAVPYQYKKRDVVYYRIDKPQEKAPRKARVHA